MHRLSVIISEIYNKFLPLAENSQVKLSLDFPDTTQKITDPETLKSELEEHISSALARTKSGEITISVQKQVIQITDSGTILSKPVCTLMSNARIQVKSRVGFGTTVTISLVPTTKTTD